VLGLTTLVTVALVGHASVGSHVALAMLAAVVHLAAMATWLGGLTLLLAVVLPRLARAPRVSTRALGQWSAVAFGAVAALVVTGEYQGWRQVQPLPALWTTAYGITLLIKVALVCVALAGAYVAQRVIVRRDGARIGSGRARLAVVRRSVRFEACAVALVLVATTVLVSQPPAAASYGPPVTITTQLGGEDDVRITVDTTRRGPEAFTVTVVGPDGKPVAAQQIAGTLSSKDNGVAGIDVHFVQGPGRSWHSVDATVPLAGTWTITLDVSVDEATGYATQADFQVW
jgi:copper transport protein